MQKKLSEFENQSDFEIKKVIGYYRDGSESVQLKKASYGLYGTVN